MTAVGRPDTLHRQAEDSHQRFRVAGATRADAGQIVEQVVVDQHRRQREVHAQGGPPVRRSRFGREPQEAGRERLPALGRELEARCGGVAPVSDQQVVAGIERRGEVEPAIAAARRPDHAAQVGADDDRPAGLVREATGDQAEDSDREGTPGEQRRSFGTSLGTDAADAGTVPDLGAREGRCHAVAPSRRANRAAGLRQRQLAGRLPRGRQPERLPDLRQRDAHQVTPGRVGHLERGGQLGRLLRRAGEEQPGGVERLTNPTGGIEARGQDEPHRLEVCGGRVHLRSSHQGCDPGPGRGAHPIQTEPRDGPVLPEDGDDVRDGADGGQVGELEGLGCGIHQVPEEQPRHGERHPAARQPRIRIDRVGALRVDHGDRCGHHVRDMVVVGDHDIDPVRGRGLDLGHAGRAGVDRDDEGDTLAGGRVDRRQRQPVALLEARRDVRHRVQAQPAERENHLGQTGQPVRVEVAEHHHPLATVPGERDPIDDGRRVGQQVGIVEASERRSEERIKRHPVGNAPARKDRGRDQPETVLARRVTEVRRQAQRLREHPAVAWLDHHREHATTGLSASCPAAGGRPPRPAEADA